MKTFATVDFPLLVASDSYAQAEDMPLMAHLLGRCSGICSQTALSSTDC